MSSSLGHEILSRWQRFWFSGQPRKAVELTGLHASARAFAIANLVAESELCVAVVCAEEDDAVRMHQDIRFFLGLLGDASLQARADYLPGWEHSPYQQFHPSIKDRIRRLRALTRLRHGESRVLVTHVEAFAQRCPSLSRLEERAFSLKPGQVITRDELVLRLEKAGYLRSDPVEDPGSFTVRGSLFDIFSSAQRRPFRLDFFDDVLESVRSYDPITQRTDPSPLSEATIIPVSELSFSSDELSRSKSAIKRFCDDYGIPKKARDSLFDLLDAGARDPTLEYLAPFFTGEPGAWLPEYFDQRWTLAVSDSIACEASFDELIGLRKTEFERAVSEGRIAVPVEQLYVPDESYTQGLAERVSLKFEPLALGVPEAAAEPDLTESGESKPEETGPSLPVKLVTNEDLRPKEGHKFSLEIVNNKAETWASRGYARIFVATTTSQAERISFLLNQKKLACRIVDRVSLADSSAIQIVEGALSSGFRLPDRKLAFVTDAELFGPKKLRIKSVERTEVPADLASFVSSLEDLTTNDLVVHSHHGIGRYRGLVKLVIDRVPQDFLLLEYAGADKLYLPVYRLDQVQRYVGAQEGVTLDKLGSSYFEKTKEKVKAALHDLAAQLLSLYAKRATRSGFSFSPPDEHYREFEAQFPYAETPDQQKAIEAVLADMESERIMDRLICGDVGYGKTEVAMRAAYRAVMDGKQVAVLVPTTVLALQHERSFTDRFANLPAKIGVLSRFKSPKEVKDTLTAAKEGKVDIIIGTHRLLSRDVQFKDLGLIVVDEEQRFGVEHKERLKLLRANIDVLTLTATPIPRTLQLSLMGMRDISVINTPPVDRLSVRTYVARFEDDSIRRAIEQELGRGGQVFFIHNRVQSINAMADRLQKIVPQARLIVAHGQLDEKELERRMLDFYNKKGNVLLCSTIIESGLDIPSANTMIINRADAFGLAQLYQLRGRVGRSQLRAYCYLLLPEEGAITDDARKRLEVIQRFVDLGSGFKVASHDLELRGGGDILGKSQTGHIASVGFELYSELLEEAIRELRGQPVEDHFDPEMKLPVPTLLPEPYVPDVQQRLALYKRLSQAASPEALHDLELELQDRYGKPPVEVQNLLWLIRLKQILRQFHIKSLVAGAERTALDASPSPQGTARISVPKMLALVQSERRTYSVTPDSKIILNVPFQSAQHLFHEVERFLSRIAEG